MYFANRRAPALGEVVITSATCSFAVSLVASRGFKVGVSTGKGDQAAFLQELGAGEIINR